MNITLAYFFGIVSKLDKYFLEFLFPYKLGETTFILFVLP